MFGAECDPDDTLLDVLGPLRAQSPVPLLVTRDDQVVGLLDLDAIIPWFGSDVSAVLVREAMSAAPEVDAGESPETGVARMRAERATAVVVTENAGGLFGGGEAQAAGIVCDDMV